jgi:pimeloyl-ACP methyl ester carboxylesterase
MSPSLCRDSANIIVRILTVALLLPAVSCTAVRNSARTAAPRAGAAFESAYRTWQTLPSAKPAAMAERTAWRVSLGGLLQALENHSPPRTWTGTQSIDGWTVTFNGETSGLLAIRPSTCEKITAVDPSKSLRKIEQRVSGDGVGLPVVMVQRRDPGNPDPFFPPNGRHLPATLTADFSGDRKISLTFHHTRNVHTARVHGATRPLAYDLSAAIAGGMDRRFLGKYAFLGVVRPDKHLREAGIYTPEPYDPKKIPVVLVHGLESAPYIWANVMNSIAADPSLRNRYQAWYFLYPSGITIQAAAATLRKSLKDSRDYYDPKHQSAAMQRMVIAGHSMGGLLAQMQVIDSGESIYRAFFTVPLDRLPASGQSIQFVRESLYFKPLPFVKRVVFIATPHRGSEVADLSIWRLARSLLQPAKLLGGVVKEVFSIARYALNPQLARFRDLGASTAEGLSPSHPLLAAMNECRIQVPYHNIIPVFQPFGSSKPVEESSDGIVRYRSSWMPGAQSTATVKSFHICVENPGVAKEMDRILRIHAGANNR